MDEVEEAWEQSLEANPVADFLVVCSENWQIREAVDLEWYWRVEWCLAEAVASALLPEEEEAPVKSGCLCQTLMSGHLLSGQSQALRRGQELACSSSHGEAERAAVLTRSLIDEGHSAPPGSWEH